jgi:hypothetical protein
MVRRQGKRKTQASLGSGNGEKKEKGESSSLRVAAPGVHRPTKKVHWMQRDNLQEPGSFCSHLLFKSDCFE